MGFDPFSAISEAQVNVLCLPAAKLDRNRFEEYTGALQACSLISVNSVQHKDNTHRENVATSFTGGSVFLNITSHYGKNESSDLFPLTLNRQPQIVLGLIEGADTSASDIDKYHDTLCDLSENFQKHVATYRHLLYSATVVFGGSTSTDIEDCLWVDVDGNGPAVPDVLAHVVGKLYQHLPLVLNGLQNYVLQSGGRLGDPNGEQSNQAAYTSESLSAKDRQSSDRNQEFSTNSVSGMDNESQGNETVARHSVLHGLLSLQAGQWPEAMRRFADGAVAASGFGDNLWHAKSLEGILACMMLFAWTHIEFNIPQICYPGNDRNNGLVYPQPFATIITANRSSSISLFSGTSLSSTQNFIDLIPHLIGTILGLYDRAADIVQNSAAYLYLYEAQIRWTRMLISIKKREGVLDDYLLRQLVEGITGNESEAPKSSKTPNLVLKSNMLARILTDTASKAQEKLLIQQAAYLYIAVSTSLSQLGLERKQGFQLKELLQKLGPSLHEARRLGAAEVGMHPAVSLPPIDIQATKTRSAQSSGIRALLDIIVKVYDLPLCSHQYSLDSDTPTKRLREALRTWILTRTAGDLSMKLEIISLCIDISDAMSDPEGMLYFTTCLLQTAKNVMTLGANASDASPIISTTDQSRLIDGLKRAVNTAGRYGNKQLRAVYWDKFLVRQIYLLEDPQTNSVVPHAAVDISTTTSQVNHASKEPFIFNPFAKAKVMNSAPLIAVGDLAQFMVVLQNPLEVDIEIESIILVTEGCEFTSLQHSIVLGPLCTQGFTLSGIPREPGSLRITGCKATIQDCYEETFLILPNEWKAPGDLKHQLQPIGQLSIDDLQIPSEDELSIQVIESLPTLSIISSSLLQPSLMLLEGESSRIELLVRNVSAQEIDLVMLSFDNSVKKRLEEALNNKDLNPADVYEIQYQLANQPAMRWLNERSDVVIPAGQEATFVVEIYGYAGLTSATTLINYAQIGKSKERLSSPFYTRQLNYTITTTVNSSIDVSRCLMLPLQNNLKWNYDHTTEQETIHSKLFAEITSRAKPNEHAILLLDVRNVWPQPLEVEFQVLNYRDAGIEESAKKTDMYKASEVLQPGQMTRILLLVSKILIQDPHAMVPILDTKRQFVVSASKMTIEAEAASRELFWYRERLLQYLSAKWTEQGGKRTGELDMRKGLRLTSRMIDVLRIDHIELHIFLKPVAVPADSNHGVTQNDDTHFSLTKNRFATIVATVHNHSDKDLKLLLRLQPSLRNQPHNIALDVSKRFAWSGALQRALHPPLAAKQSRHVELGVVAFAAGAYEINGSVEETVRLPDNSIQLPGTTTVSERRIWYARHACAIDVVEP